MARKRLATACAVALVLAGGAAVAAASSAAAAPMAATGGRAATAGAHPGPAVRPAHPHARVVVFDCRGHAQVRPRRFVISCADGNDYLTRLRWFTWGPLTAFGQGVEWRNDCVPSCVAGHFVHHHVHVVFWQIRPVGRHHHGEYRFTRLTVGHVTHVL